MGRRVKTVQHYIDFLESKGFALGKMQLVLSNLDNNIRMLQMN